VAVTHSSETIDDGEDQQPGALRRWRPEARTVAAGLRTATTALAVPATLVAAGAAVAFLVVAVLAATALAGGSTVVRWLVLAVAVVGLVATVLFVLRVRSTWRASRDADALADELLGLVDLQAVTTAALADLSEVTAREGGLRAASRARALWRLLRRLDVTEHVGSFERARWFVPPEVGTTWLLAQVVTWGGLVGWVLVPAVAGARLAGWF